MRARTRAIAASAGAALVVIPLTGAAAVALVSQGHAVPSQDSFAETGAAYGNSVSEDATSVVAGVTATFSVDTPEVNVEALPAPRPAVVRQARPVANSADVAQAIAGSAVIAEAAKYVGYPYRPGGKSPATGFDCSGFVSYVYSQFGISLPSSSSGYYNVGTRVDSPMPGDIILTPGHVGLYAGPNLQIDAPTSGHTIQFRSIWQRNPIYIRVS
jgi:cell wall-associated NlpC family hydrolase